MSRRAASPPRKPKLVKPLPPNLPQHNFSAPYNRLLEIGDEEQPALYDEIAAALRDKPEAVGKLLEMALDETYYEYGAEDETEDPRETRGWTRLHAVCVLERMGPPAEAVIEPLLPLLNEEDDYVREEMPFYYAAMGRAAIAPLVRVLNDTTGDTFLRGGAGESLAEIGEKHPELRDEIVSLLELRLANEMDDETVAAFLVCNLLDLGARESLPIIQKAFADERVDEEVLDLGDVEEHFGLPRTAPRRVWEQTARGGALSLDDQPPGLEHLLEAAQDEEEPVSVPYVSENKTGRNDPCPCGSGKKYKKCCGA